MAFGIRLLSTAFEMQTSQIAKQLERWLCDSVLPNLRKTVTYSVSAQVVEDQQSLKQALDNCLLRTQIESLHEDVIAKRISNKSARLTLALAAQETTEVFGSECSSQVMDA